MKKHCILMTPSWRIPAKHCSLRHRKAKTRRIVQVEKLLKLAYIHTECPRYFPGAESVKALYRAAIDLQFRRGRRLGLPTPIELGLCITTDGWKEMVDRWEQLRQKNQEMLKHSRLKRRRFLRRAKGKWDYKWQRKKLRIRRLRDDWE